MAYDPKFARDLFLTVSELPLDRQMSFLFQACAGDSELHAEVMRLLAAHAAPASLLDPAPPVSQELAATFGASSAPAAPAAGAGAGIVLAGRYTLVEEIGAGGMGSVWVARQTAPVKRRVAIKLIKPGMDSREVLARFEAERQALAMMDHPNIAKVLDGGIAPDGRPFFVMELVKGMPITRYCDERKLTPRERLDLFVPVCLAIQHAHQKGIIHRDIKPSNVLIALYDDRPVPKVIDFGIAKATGQPLTDETINTGFGGIVGTPEYMSPEQATLNNLDVDTRSDIYSLGALLYELLTGSPPFSRSELHHRGLMEILRIVREDEPLKPSTKLSTAEMLPTLSANRGTEPKKLTALLRSELDWIVLKALEKDRARRYETANGLAADVQRYLAGEPVFAHPPGAAYRLRKFLRKHRGPAIAASLVFLALAAGVIGTTMGLLEARHRAEGERDARLDAQASAALARQRLVEVEAARNKAQEEREIASEVQMFLQNRLLHQADSRWQVDSLLQAGAPASALKQNPTIRELLDRTADELAEDKIEANFPNRPLLQSEILQTVGNTYAGVGEFERAISFLRRAEAIARRHLGPDNPDSLVMLSHLAVACREAGRLKEAIDLHQEVRQGFIKTLGPEDPATLFALGSMAATYFHAGRLKEAIEIYERVRDVQIRTPGPDHHDTLITLHNLATALRFADRQKEAIELFERVRDISVKKYGADHPSTLITLSNLADAYQSMGRVDEAIAIFEHVRDSRKNKVADDDPYVLNTLSNLAGALQLAGRMDESIALSEKAREGQIKKFGAEHPATLNTTSALAASYRDVGRVDEAIALFEQARGPQIKALGLDHHETLKTLAEMAGAYRLARRLPEAIALYEQVRDAQIRTLAPDHPKTLTTINNLAATYWTAKQLEKSIPLFEDLVRSSEKKFGREHLETQKVVANLGINYKDAGRVTESIPLLEEAWRSSGKYPALRVLADPLLDAYTAAGQTVPFVKLSEELLGEARQALPKESPKLAAMMARYSQTLLELKAWPDAERVLRECLNIREKTQADAWTTFSTKSMLGEALLGQKKYTEAEPLLLAGYEGLKARESKIPAGGATRLPEAVDRLIDLYSALNKPDEAARWKAERAKYLREAAPPPGEKK